MCTYSQLKKNTKTICATPHGSMVPLMSQNCMRLADKIYQNVVKVER